jgi:(2Fe-2S) ferredoxin
MPKPEKHVFVCIQTRPPGHPRGSCFEKGASQVMEAFIQQIQTRNLFERFAITNSGCIGPCDNGPSVLIYPDSVMYSGVTATDVAEIIDKHLLEGEVVERLKAPAEVWS